MNAAARPAAASKRVGDHGNVSDRNLAEGESKMPNRNIDNTKFVVHTAPSEDALSQSAGVGVARNEARNTVLDKLAGSKAMSLVELTSAIDLPDSEIEEIVKSLKSENLVWVSGSGLDEIITIREQGLRAAG